MALDFTDDQIKELSGQVLQGPDLVAEANKQVALIIQQKQDFKDLDEQNTVFTDNMINILDQFHKELKELDGTVKTLYDEANIELAAQLDPSNLHYPANTWQFFYPKVLDSNTGLPTSATGDLMEIGAIDDIQEQVDFLINGFSDGAISAASDGAISGGQIPYDTNPGFSVGQRIVLLAGGGTTGASFGVVTGTTVIPPPTPPPVLPGSFVVNYTVEFTSGSLPAGTVVSNFHGGFSNAQREAPTSNLYQIYRQDQIDTDTGEWRGIVGVIEGILNANDSTADKAEIDAEKAEISNAISAIDMWAGQPDTGVGSGRFGDSILGTLTNEMTAREARVPDRVAEINAALGTLTQDLGDQAKFDGDGRYFEYFTDLNARIHLSTGSLRNFYGTDTLIAFTEQTRDNAISEVERTSDILQIKLLKEDPDGSNTLSMENVSDLIVGQEVKFMDNEKPVLNYSIVDILPEEREIVLDGNVPTNYKLTKQVRLVRVL